MSIGRKTIHKWWLFNGARPGYGRVRKRVQPSSSIRESRQHPRSTRALIQWVWMLVRELICVLDGRFFLRSATHHCMGLSLSALIAPLFVKCHSLLSLVWAFLSQGSIFLSLGLGASPHCLSPPSFVAVESMFIILESGRRERVLFVQLGLFRLSLVHPRFQLRLHCVTRQLGRQ